MNTKSAGKWRKGRYASLSYCEPNFDLAYEGTPVERIDSAGWQVKGSVQTCMCCGLSSTACILWEDGHVSEEWQTSSSIYTFTCPHITQETYTTQEHAVSHSDILLHYFIMSVTQSMPCWKAWSDYWNLNFHFIPAFFLFLFFCYSFAYKGKTNEDQHIFPHPHMVFCL